MQHSADFEPPNQDIVKCVVVGDTGVGKTRMICARACGTTYTLQQLMQTHIPTVWAIDHYRQDREVVQRSWCTVDGVNVSLRLWDTFGDHEKDRRFAYGRADVILLCFSVVRPRSLRSVLSVWQQEILRICPGIPIILCGCQADLRFLYLHEEFIQLDKGHFFREIKHEDVLACTPEKGREVARQIGAFYYESSVLSHYGIEEVFSNVVRAALIHKRGAHFWNKFGHLKHINKPTCQAPYLHPKPNPPTIIVPLPQIAKDLGTLLENQAHCDVIFSVRGVCIEAHKVCLVASSAAFEELFIQNLQDIQNQNNVHNCENVKPDLKTQLSFNRGKGNGLLRGSTQSLQRKNSNGARESVSDTAKLLDNDQVELTCDETDSKSGFEKTKSLPCKLLNHPVFDSIQQQQCDDIYNPGRKVCKTVVTLKDNISSMMWQHILHYLYTGKCMENYNVLLDVLTVAKNLNLTDLVTHITNILNGEDYLNKDLKFHQYWCQRMREVIIKRNVFADVVFELDDGLVPAHKALLMVRSDVMMGMFSYNFRESSARVVSLPGTSRETFMALLDYLYTGECPVFDSRDYMVYTELIELANRLCLPRLVALMERHVVEQLSEAMEHGRDVAEDVIVLLEPAQLHNANQLAEWCLHHLATNYSHIYSHSSKALQRLTPENQIHLSKYRQPPLWYIKEVEYYEKCLVELERQKSIKSFRQETQDSILGSCLCFCRLNRRRVKCGPCHTATVAVP